MFQRSLIIYKFERKDVESNSANNKYITHNQYKTHSKRYIDKRNRHNKYLKDKRVREAEQKRLMEINKRNIEANKIIKRKINFLKRLARKPTIILKDAHVILKYVPRFVKFVKHSLRYKIFKLNKISKLTKYKSLNGFFNIYNSSERSVFLDSLKIINSTMYKHRRDINFKRIFNILGRKRISSRFLSNRIHGLSMRAIRKAASLAKMPMRRKGKWSPYDWRIRKTLLISILGRKRGKKIWVPAPKGNAKKRIRFLSSLPLFIYTLWTLKFMDNIFKYHLKIAFDYWLSYICISFCSFYLTPFVRISYNMNSYIYIYNYYDLATIFWSVLDNNLRSSSLAFKMHLKVAGRPFRKGLKLYTNKILDLGSQLNRIKIANDLVIAADDLESSYKGFFNMSYDFSLLEKLNHLKYTEYSVFNQDVNAVYTNFLNSFNPHFYTNTAFTNKRFKGAVTQDYLL